MRLDYLRPSLSISRDGGPREIIIKDYNPDIYIKCSDTQTKFYIYSKVHLISEYTIFENLFPVGAVVDFKVPLITSFRVYKDFKDASQVQ